MSGGSKRSVRVWQELDVDEVKSHLLLIEDLYGSCSNCKQLGLNYLKDSTCPSCKTDFRYLATRLTAPSDVAKILHRIHKESLPFILIDRVDFEKAGARDALGDIFGKPTEK